MTSTSARRPTRVAKLPPRERILDAAEELFLAEGIGHVGVQAIAERAGTTKMAIYRHFETKDALITEWLRIVAHDYSSAFDRAEQAHPGDLADQIRAVARFIADGLPAISHRGCPFTNSIAELPAPDHPARRLIHEHKTRQLARLTAMCAGLPDPEQRAAELTFLMEGAQVSVQNGSVEDAGPRLLRMVETILRR
ncbi:TetR/AcrR family transcriptional regulator [Amycolatopsis jejuensis]|uniref:TetR/AcrR family transcriptional regulator n=1 Tax=Amycolatopsis jejuensis TaxID=330084 RepID=UPI000525DD5A|nr:TetR/AcrR family transcriptional regulator [Amycolatopsis jejuensis]